MRSPGVMREATEGVGARTGRDDPSESPPGALGALGAMGSTGPVGGGGPGGGESGSRAPPPLRPAGRLAWWDGVSHVVTRPAREHVT